MSEEQPTPTPEASSEAPPASLDSATPAEGLAALTPTEPTSVGDEVAPPPVEGGHNLEPIVLALVFLVPPIALGGSAIALAFAKDLAWNPLAVGLVIGLVASIAFYFVVRRVFAAS